MATPTNTPVETGPRPTPSQGIFIGYLALGLLIFAVLVAAVALVAGAGHGWK